MGLRCIYIHLRMYIYMIHLLLSLSKPCTSREMMYYMSKLCGVLRHGLVSIDYFPAESAGP